MLWPNIRASGLGPCYFREWFLSINSFDLHTCSNETGKVGIRICNIELRQLKLQGVTEQELRPVVTTVVVELGSHSHLSAPGQELFLIGPSSQIATSEEFRSGALT